MDLSMALLYARPLNRISPSTEQTAASSCPHPRSP
jgi:hypothetical protein